MKRFISAGCLPDGLAAMSFFDGLVFFSPVSLLVRTTAGVSVSQFFLLQALLSGTVLLGEVPSGRLTDRIGCRRTMILCEGLFAAARILLMGPSALLRGPRAPISTVSSPPNPTCPAPFRPATGRPPVI